MLAFTLSFPIRQMTKSPGKIMWSLISNKQRERIRSKTTCMGIHRNNSDRWGRLKWPVTHKPRTFKVQPSQTHVWRYFPCSGSSLPKWLVPCHYDRLDGKTMLYSCSRTICSWDGSGPFFLGSKHGVTASRCHGVAVSRQFFRLPLINGSGVHYWPQKYPAPSSQPRDPNNRHHFCQCWTQHGLKQLLRRLASLWCTFQGRQTILTQQSTREY